MTPRHRLSRLLATWAGTVLLLAFDLLASAPLTACPFCTVLSPTLSQLRESATAVALVEPMDEVQSPKSKVQSAMVERIAGPVAAGASVSAGGTPFRLHRLLKGPGEFKGQTNLSLPGVAKPPKGLALAFGTLTASAETSLPEWTWTIVPVSEIGYAYAARAPELRIPTAERLRYFAPYLEHADPLVANDAYLEFGHAPFDDVAKAADLVPMERLRAWVVDDQVPQSRKGFYGLALGLAGTPADQRRNRELLERLIRTPVEDVRAGSDFRSGFDGLLGGYLLLAGSEGLDLLISCYFANPAAAEGDVRHALTALRFYHEYGRAISRDRQCAAMRHLLTRPQLAEQVVIDLARWTDWDALPAIAALYNRPGYDDARTRRAIVGFLLACPRTEAIAELRRLRAEDPAGVAAAEKVLGELNGVNPAAAGAGAR